MPPSALGAAAALLALAFWLLGRRRPVVVLSSTDASAVAALNRSQIAEASLESGPGPASAMPTPTPVARLAASKTAKVALPEPGALRERAAYLADLRARLAGDGPSRLAAMREARHWGHRDVLPLLRRGLRDTDLAVVREAALGLERFRGRSAGSPGPAAPQAAMPAVVPLPRNVSRTR